MQTTKKYKRVMKKHVEELVNIINEYGYWSQQVLNYNDRFEPNLWDSLHTKAKAIIRERNNIN